jgi:DNA-binding MltR family transcriptional regulator
VLDEQLAECLRSRFIDHPDAAKLVEGFNAPLGTFAARILAAFAVGCISEREYRDLETIRRIRNEFAHRLSISFDDPSIKDRCAALTFAAQDYVQVSARGKFSTAAVALILNLANRPHYLAQARTTAQPWPY